MMHHDETALTTSIDRDGVNLSSSKICRRFSLLRVHQRPRAIPRFRICNTGEAVESAVGAGAARVPANLVRDDEVIILALKPSPLFIILASLNALVFIAICTMLLAYLARVAWFSWIPWTDAQAFALGFFLAFIRLCWQTLDWWNRLFILTDRRVIRRMGVLRLSVFETPLRHVQHTSVFASIRERIFALGSVGFATAGSDTYEAFWVMIARPFDVHRVVVEAIERYGSGRAARGA